MTHKEQETLLIRVDERTAHLVDWTKDHVKLHERLSIAFIAAVVSTILSLGTTVVGLVGTLSQTN